MNESRFERHGRNRKKMDPELIKKVTKAFMDQILMKLKTKWHELMATQMYRKEAKHRKRIDSEKVEKIAERVILKTALICAVIFIPLFILGFLFFEFGGWIKDAIEFIGGIIGKIVAVIRFIAHIITLIVHGIQQILAAFKKPSS